MTALCCNQCFDFIARKSTAAARLWIDSCAYFVKFDGVFKLRETRVPDTIKHFRCLEQFGYIATADGDDAIRVRVNGYDIIESEEPELCLETFCIDREKHKSAWI